LTEKSSSKILFVEGQDERRLVEKFLEHLGIAGVHVHDVHGKDNFKNEIEAVFKTPREGDINLVGVVRDAESSASRVFQSTADIFKRLSEKLEIPRLATPSKPEVFSEGTPRVGVFIVPNGAETGMLEDMCLKSVENHEAMQCADTFWECAESLSPPPKNPAKARAQAFLAAMPEIVKCVGEGAEKKYWDFDSDAFSALHSFLENFR